MSQRGHWSGTISPWAKTNKLPRSQGKDEHGAAHLEYGAIRGLGHDCGGGFWGNKEGSAIAQYKGVTARAIAPPGSSRVLRGQAIHLWRSCIAFDGCRYMHLWFGVEGNFAADSNIQIIDFKKEKYRRNLGMSWSMRVSKKISTGEIWACRGRCHLRCRCGAVPTCVDLSGGTRCNVCQAQNPPPPRAQ